MLSHGVIFNLGSFKLCQPAIIETYYYYDKDICIAATDYYIYFYPIMVFLLVAILPLINFTASKLTLDKSSASDLENAPIAPKFIN